MLIDSEIYKQVLMTHLGIDHLHGQRRWQRQEPSPQILTDHYPSHLPSVPHHTTVSTLIIPNPYATRGIPEHPRIRAELKAALEGEEGAYAGMLKFRIRQHNTQNTSMPTEHAYLHRQSLSKAVPGH